MGNSEPTASELGIGAVVGGSIGALIPGLLDTSSPSSSSATATAPATTSTSSSKDASIFDFASWFSSSSEDEPAMKVGFPQF